MLFEFTFKKSLSDGDQGVSFEFFRTKKHVSERKRGKLLVKGL